MTTPLNHNVLFTALCASQLVLERERASQEAPERPWTASYPSVLAEHLADLHGLEIEAAGLVRHGGRS